MTPEERDDLLRNAPPEEGLAAKYEHLLHAFQGQERIMKKVAEKMRILCEGVTHSVHFEEWMLKFANELDPPEPMSEADAAEKFSGDAAARRKAT